MLHCKKRKQIQDPWPISAHQHVVIVLDEIENDTISKKKCRVTIKEGKNSVHYYYNLYMLYNFSYCD